MVAGAGARAERRARGPCNPLSARKRRARPAEGFKASGAVSPGDLPGIAAAAAATLSLGAVLGPEAPLIAIGSGLGVLAIRLLKRDAPATGYAVIGAAGSFAAISTMFGSPLPARFS